MIDDLILSLALQAITDPDAREVLQDALLEHGPSVSVTEPRQHPVGDAHAASSLGAPTLAPVRGPLEQHRDPVALVVDVP